MQRVLFPYIIWERTACTRYLNITSECTINNFPAFCSCFYGRVFIGSFKGLSFSCSTNLILNLASGRCNIRAELSSGSSIKSLIMNRDAAPANRLNQWLCCETHRLGMVLKDGKVSEVFLVQGENLLIRLNPLVI